MLVKQKYWVTSADDTKTPTKLPTKHAESKSKKDAGLVDGQVRHVRMIWEGIFYMIWHSDKPSYQKSCCEKIAGIMSGLHSQGHK